MCHQMSRLEENLFRIYGTLNHFGKVGCKKNIDTADQEKGLFTHRIEIIEINVELTVQAFA